MLVLSRKENERIMIGENIEIVVCQIKGNKVRLGIEAPKEIPIDLFEVHAAKMQGRELRKWQKWHGDGEGEAP